MLRAQIVEAHSEIEYAKEHLPRATNIPPTELNPKSTSRLNRGTPIAVSCWSYLSDLSSPRAAWRPESLAFTQANDYVAGNGDWLAAGLPGVTGKAERPITSRTRSSVQ